MEPGLAQRLGLGLASLPRLARSGRTERASGVGALGSAAGMGAAAATATAVGTRRAADVEPDRRR
ncbi:hypothetical protein A5625_26030 [Mycobacterium sp. 1465703.0]|nr:hypothetical protein A5625_26030 [Mycobacterium sp. 1465703.0]